MISVAWAGASLFITSLAYFLYFYGIQSAAVAPSTSASGLPAVAIDVATFSIFALHHSVMARSGAKAWLVQRLPAELERSAYVWIASLLFIAVCALWQPVPGVVWRASGALRWVLHGAQLIGAALALNSLAMVDPLTLVGIRQVRGDTREVTFKAAGSFRLVRHPMYTGWILMVFAMPLMTMTRLVFASVSTLYVVTAIPWEERSLVEANGDRYRAYQRQVRWRLLPGVW